MDASGSAYVTGNTSSVDFPTTPWAFDTTFSPTFVLKIGNVGPPPTLTLNPPAASNPVDTQHCVAATVGDASGTPLSGVTVRFKVRGAVNTRGSATTDGNGDATFCYMGPPRPGADRVTAYADTDQDHVQDPGEPGGVAMTAWVGASVALTPEADAYVRNGRYASQNFGSATHLIVKQIATPEYERESYLKFNLRHVPPIGKAVLRLTGALSDTRDGGNVVTGVYPVRTHTWTELGITWNTKPAAASSPVASFGVSGTATCRYEVDLTSFIRAEKAAGRTVVTLALKNPGPSLAYAKFGSKESGPDRPTLMITPLADPVTLTPVADTFVRAGAYEERNFGMHPDLTAKVHSDPNYQRESLLRFDLTTVSSIERAVLRLTGALSDAREPSVATNVHPVADQGWTETSTTWTNRPSAAPSPIATITVSGTTKRLHGIDVTAFLQAEKAAGRQVVTFALRNSAASLPYVRFGSRESGGEGPVLVVTPESRHIADPSIQTTRSTSVGPAASQARVDSPADPVQNAGFY